YDGLVKSYNLDKDLFSSYGNVYSLKRDREDEDKDEDPPAGSNKGWKKRKMNKDAKPPKGSKSKESKLSSSKGTKPLPKSSGNTTTQKAINTSQKDRQETIAQFLGALERGGAFVPLILLAVLDDAFLILQKGG
ncbi:hypothetical protein Tco_0595729, partial [Tanacetum coccineum]